MTTNARRLLIRDAQVVLPTGIAATNVLIEDGKILAIDASRTSAADEVIEAAGLTLLPGVIDDQVHFRDPGLTHKEDVETGSMACAAGGVTTFLEMPNTVPPATTREAIAWKYDCAASVCRVNFGFYIGATEQNIAELQRVENVPGIKIFIGSSTGDLLVDSQAVLERIFAETSLPICAHCEDELTVCKQGSSWGFAERGRSLTHSQCRSSSPRNCTCYGFSQNAISIVFMCCMLAVPRSCPCSWMQRRT